ncbi:Linear gramicidin synthase subunit B [Rosistilla carotiformis]|uniref:Linear gramicidin synthase subunit B n=1 Tax=Rosistilla carotiformis TaxID=2528017 RepID=A0A518JYE7_9BACT|nr:non-ribosomal peptide synthetase [Rosistilla carotiformis]QDV70564.1 Linear gramicidin synthase subunit B [Rosistilla carotiformis]
MISIDPLVDKLVADLRQRGVKLWNDGGLLRFSASKSALSPALMLQMRKHKAAILELLQQESPDDDDDQQTGPVSLGQESLWLLHKQFPDSPAYNTAATLRFVAPVEVAALRAAFQKLIARHEPLRTTFAAAPGHDVHAVVHSSATLDFQQADVADEAALHQRVRSEYLQPFRLDQSPLMRVRLFTRSANDQILLIVVHHIVFDAFSLWVMQDELKQLYASEVAGTDCLLPALPAQYSDFVRWQREFPETAAGNKQWDYWKQQLAGDPVPAELLWDRPRPRRSAARGATLHFPIDNQLAAGLRQLGRENNATPLAVGLAVFQTLMYRLTHIEDAVVGMTTAGRSTREYANAIGYFVNTLPIRGRIQGKLKFADVLTSAMQTTVEARQAQDFPFALLVQRLRPVRDLSAPPLCRVVFGLQKPMAGDDVASLLAGSNQSVEWGDTRVACYPMDQQEGQFDLVLELYQTPDGYTGVLKYDLNLMHTASAKRFADQFAHLLGQVVDDPHRDVDDYSIVPDAERAQLRQWAIAPQINDPQHLRFDRWFESQAAASPETSAAALGEHQLSYAELDALTNRVGRLLQQHGASIGSHVIVACGRTIEAPVLMLACFKIGAAYVPMSPTTPEVRACQMVSDCNPALVIAVPSLAHSLAQELPQQRVLDAATLLNLAADLDDARIGAAFGDETTAYVICTSGSTGTPKGIAVSHAALCRHTASMREVFGTTAADRMYQFSDLTFDPSIEQMVVPWSVGGAVVFRDDNLPSVEEFWQTMLDQKITIANLPPKYFEECSRAIPFGDAWPRSLRLMIVGGDVFPRDVASDWIDRGVRLLNAYGPTETVITATTCDVTADWARLRLPIGKPKPGSTAFVLDRRHRQMPIGVAGELYLGGPMLADGYVNLPEETAQRFIQVEVDGVVQRMYRSGDLTRWNSEGQLEFLGRIDRQVKIRGFRIELGDIEAALALHPSVSAGIVKAFEDAGDTYLAAFLTTEPSDDVSVESIVSHLKGRLPIYMVPQRVVILDQLPLLASGKVDSNQLHADPPSTAVLHRAYVAPQTQVQQILAEVWASVLNLERVGIDDDFYDLGGGSLQALRIVSELSAQDLVSQSDDDGLPLSPQMLFQYTTISELSPHLRLAST